ncbi:MAG: GAF domain-containing protein, partial [Nitrospirae bacterium]|nr:GAF domain-containing protein [Nitrospirota bacterium]
MSAFWLATPILAAFAALFLAGAVLLRRPSGLMERAVSAVFGACALIQGANALALLDNQGIFFWRQLALLGEVILPVAIFKVGVSMIREDGAAGRQTGVWRFRVLAFMGGLLALWVSLPIVLSSHWEFMDPAPAVFRVLGKVVGVFILVSLVLALAQLEQVLRAARDPLRYQLKFTVIGLGGLAGFAIVHATQFQPFATLEPGHTFVGGLVTLFSLALIGYGLWRSKLKTMSHVVYISPQALYVSITFLIVGLYFVLVGGFGELVQLTGWEWSKGFRLLLVFIAAVGLVVVLCSRWARAELRLFVARHFYKSKYDYRLKWIEVNEAFRTCHSAEEILDGFLDLLGQTFGAPRIGIWMYFDSDGNYHQVRSVNTESPPKPLDAAHPVVHRFLAAEGPFELKGEVEKEDARWHHFLEATHALLFVPLRNTEALMGFVTLSGYHRVGQYSLDDYDLLRAITHQVEILLSKAKLSEEQTAAAEWEALNKISAFYLHDLKTLAAGLSLVAQNAQVHGKDPVFQNSAMRTVSNTVEKIMTLMSKLSSKSCSPIAFTHESFQKVNVNELVREAVDSLTDFTCKPVLTMASNLS